MAGMGVSNHIWPRSTEKWLLPGHGMLKSEASPMKFFISTSALRAEVHLNGRCAEMRWFSALCLLLLQTGAHGFDLNEQDTSLSHQEITEAALLKVTLEVCHAVAKAVGRYIKEPSGSLTATKVAVACEAEQSSKSFSNAIEVIKDENVGVDQLFFWSSHHHFDAEQFTKGKKLVTDGIAAVKANNKLQKYEAARERLGQLFHTLQDFYSHSNWVEIGNKNPNTNLIKVNADIGKTADKDRATCRSCVGDDCKNNILEDILKEKILTTGYFDAVPPSSKPAGKCSHGGKFDRTRKMDPKGGINKDTLDSEHGHLHNQAANMAIAATSEVLQDVRAAAGDKEFLQMMGIKKGKPLCFVIDTTGSMGNDISTVRTITAAIIDSKAGTDDEPSDYVLVPFNDPDYGPLTRTTNADDFKNAIYSLSADGGGDFAEMSLSGIQLALTGSPPGSEIYVFTDASAKDGYLLGRVLALIERTKSVVTVLITGSLGLRRRRETLEDNPLGSVYKQLAEASGGQAIQVSKSELAEVTSIITDTSSSSVVKLLQASRNAGNPDNFTFSVDDSVKNLTMYITGRSLAFTITSPSGVTQSSTDTTGPLVVSSSTVGNFQTVKLNTQVGVWKVEMVSTSAYNLKVVGENHIDFLFTFLKDSESPYGGLEVLSNRPRSGENITLRVTVTGSDSATVTEVTLVEFFKSVMVNGSVEDQGKGVFHVRFDTIPSDDFVVLVMGQTNTSSTRNSATSFQRQSSSSIKASAVSVSITLPNRVAEPGVSFSVPFSVSTSGTGGTFTIAATNDQGYSSSFPPSLSLPTGGSANSTGTITAPPDTPSGTDVTLTIEATSPGGDTNYVVLRLTVLVPVTDVTAPVCQLSNVTDSCSDICTESTWGVSMQVRDEVNGTGIHSITFRQGDGNLNTTLLSGTDSIMLLTYNASCCSPDVEIIAVDNVGNVKSCFFSVRRATTAMSTTLITTTTAIHNIYTKSTTATNNYSTNSTTAANNCSTNSTTDANNYSTKSTTDANNNSTKSTTDANNNSTNSDTTTTTIVTTPSKTSSAAVPLSTGAAQLFVLFLSAIILSLC
uniref:von Willebrand factor A domain-containing protein 7-like isoform X1 n=1 Tax=Solea senegalensis TaxID=28829 RepID=UPI001CD84031|nr:von Willebrand factor A domain-containing protein 7-like isoform X1 [Solea senegalensis]